MTRIAGLVLVVVAIAGAQSAQAQASASSSTLISANILGGGGPVSTGQPRSVPYIQGWSVAVAPPGGLLESPVQSGGVAVDARTRWVYAGTSEGDVVCIVDGLIRWRTAVGSAVSAPPTLHRELLVVPTSEGVLVALNAVNGKIVSRAILGEELITQPKIVETLEHVVALVGSSAETLFAVELDYGQKLWRVQRESPGGFSLRGFARPVVLNGVVYAGFADGWVQALDFATGAVRWERQLSPSGDQVDVDALATDGVRLYATSASGGVYALSPEQGTVLWRTPVATPVSLALHGSTLYVGAPGQVLALRSFDGKPGWKFSFGIGGASDLRISEGLVIFSELDGPMYFVDARSGRPRGLFSSGDGFASPPAVSGNALYALSNGGRVYALGVIP